MQRREYLAGAGLLGASAVVGGCLSTGASDPARSTGDTRTGTAPPGATNADGSPGADGGIEVGQQVPRATVSTLEGREVRLSEYDGRRLFWLFATWCPSCQQSATVLQRHDGDLQSVTVLAARMHENAGFSGPSVREFVVANAPDTLDSERWVWGATGEETTRTFSPRGTVDLFYLVDEDGTVRTVDTVPGTSIDEIRSFADG